MRESKLDIKFKSFYIIHSLLPYLRRGGAGGEVSTRVATGFEITSDVND